MKSVTIRDVAAATGTSSATVSRALQDKPGVSDELRAKLKAAAARLKYVPRSVVKPASIMVLVFPAHYIREGSLVYARGIEVLYQRTADSAMFLTTQSDHPAEFKALQRAVNEPDASILVYFCAEPSPAVVELAAKRGLPIVLIHRYIAGPNISSFTVNDVHGGALVAEHFLAMGRKNSVFLLPEVNVKHYAAEQRFKGFHERMTAGGGSVKTVVSPRLALNLRIDYVKEKAGDFDSLFAYSDLEAKEFVEAGQLSGVRIPEEVSVVGYNNSHHVEETNPNLSSVYWPIEKVCHCVMDHIERYINGQGDVFPIQLSIQPQLIVRGSSCGQERTQQ